MAAWALVRLPESLFRFLRPNQIGHPAILTFDDSNIDPMQQNKWTGKLEQSRVILARSDSQLPVAVGSLLSFSSPVSPTVKPSSQSASLPLSPSESQFQSSLRPTSLTESTSGTAPYSPEFSPRRVIERG